MREGEGLLGGRVLCNTTKLTPTTFRPTVLYQNSFANFGAVSEPCQSCSSEGVDYFEHLYYVAGPTSD